MNENKFEQRLLDGFDKIDNRIKTLESRFGNIEQTTAWIKGNLEGRGETRRTALSSIALFLAILAWVIVLVK